MSLGSVLGAIGTGIGTYLNYNQNKDMNAQQAYAEQQRFEKNVALQKEFAQNAVKWKVDDALQSGIHPLYALGAPTMSFSPQALGDIGSNKTDFAKSFSSMGADLGTAIAQGMPKSGKVSVAAQTATNLQLEGMQLDNDIKRAKLASDIAKVSQPGAGSIPESGPFVVPEAKKPEDRPGIMSGGSRIQTDPGTSPAKAWEDWLGDDLFSPGFLPNLYGALRQQYGEIHTWPMQVVSSLGSAMMNDLRAEAANARRFFGNSLPRFGGR